MAPFFCATLYIKHQIGTIAIIVIKYLVKIFRMALVTVFERS